MKRSINSSQNQLFNKRPKLDNTTWSSGSNRAEANNSSNNAFRFPRQNRPNTTSTNKSSNDRVETFFIDTNRDPRTRPNVNKNDHNRSYTTSTDRHDHESRRSKSSSNDRVEKFFIDTNRDPRTRPNVNSNDHSRSYTTSKDRHDHESRRSKSSSNDRVEKFFIDTNRDTRIRPNMNANEPSRSNSKEIHIDAYEKMSNAIHNYFLKNVQTYECYEKKQDLRYALYKMFEGIIPYIGVYIVGSSANGFGSNKSDVDMCLMVSHEEIDQKTEAVALLKTISKALRKAGFVRHLLLIKAKVPIIKFHDCYNHIDCDLNVNNHNGIRNTHLLKYYSEIDWRVRPLVLQIKHWAKFHNINDAAQQTISSYSLVLMVIFYLQCVCKPSILPVLQQIYPEIFNIKTDVKDLNLNMKLDKWKSMNGQSLGELFVGFLAYYSNFDYKNNVISVRTGRLIPVSNYLSRYENSTYSQWKYLCIEEPFELTNTARSVYDFYIFQRILKVFKKSYEKISRSNFNIEELFYRSFFDDD